MMAQEDVNGSRILRSCVRCGHVRVCSIFRAVAPLLANWEEGSKPFEAESLAAVCREFIAESIVQVLRQGGGPV